MGIFICAAGIFHHLRQCSFLGIRGLAPSGAAYPTFMELIIEGMGLLIVSSPQESQPAGLKFPPHGWVLFVTFECIWQER